MLEEGDGAPSATVDAGPTLELDVPTVRPRPRRIDLVAADAAQRPATQPAVPQPLPALLPDPNAPPAALSRFVDPETGMVRTWVVATLVALCIFATLTGRVMRMRTEKPASTASVAPAK